MVFEKVTGISYIQSIKTKRTFKTYLIEGNKIVNIIAISGEVIAQGVVKGKPGFSVLLFQVKNTVGFGERAVTSVLNVKKMGKSVDNIAKYITAGKKVNVSGYLQITQVQSNGMTKSVPVIVASNIDLGYDDKKSQPRNNGGDDFADAASPEPENQDTDESVFG
jgi:single-stranded DNA-binding protein